MGGVYVRPMFGALAAMALAGLPALTFATDPWGGPPAPTKYRNRRKAERRAKRRNLNHVSKRTRRQHRRAKRA